MDQSGKVSMGLRKRTFGILGALTVITLVIAYVTTIPIRSCIAEKEARLLNLEYRDLPDRAFNAALVLCYNK